MIVEKNRVVSLSYELVVEGNLADKAGADKPLEYIHGTGMLLPKFEAEVAGMEPGNTFAFTLTPEEGYGEYNPQYLVNIPVAAFKIDGEIHEELLTVGRTLPMLNGEGQVIQGTVAAVSDENVTMDFNHPMAGKTLNFTGKIESVRFASDKELKEGLHGEFLPPEEACGCCHSGGHESCNCSSEGENAECRCHGGQHKGNCCKSL